MSFLLLLALPSSSFIIKVTSALVLSVFLPERERKRKRETERERESIWRD
jgi:hypothetical protein